VLVPPHALEAAARAAGPRCLYRQAGTEGRSSRRGERGPPTSPRTGGSRAREGAQGDRHPGKRLRVVGIDARAQQRAARRDVRDTHAARAALHAMIEQGVTELTPLIGTRPACRALGMAPATLYRRRRPVRSPAAAAPPKTTSVMALS